MRTNTLLWILPGFLLLFSSLLYSHVDKEPSVHDVIAGIKERILKQLSPDKILALNVKTVRKFLQEKEAYVLGHGLIKFNVNIPVQVYIIRSKRLKKEPFWLKERDFKKTPLQAIVDGENCDVWSKLFPTGRIGFGVNSLHRKANQYLIAIKPQNAGDTLQISHIYPGQCRLAKLQKSVRAYMDDDDDLVDSIPKSLAGITFIQGSDDWDEVGLLSRTFHKTRFPSSYKPDQIVLTWSDDPKTTQTIQWRTSTHVKKGVVAYIKKSEYKRFKPKSPKYVQAQTKRLETKFIVNDPVCHRHSITLKQLQPNTAYLYMVGDGTDNGWSEMAEFTTAPDRVIPFSFVYMGDAQNGLDRWGSLLKNAFRQRPDAKFYIMAGDLVNRGNERWDWDDFFYNSQGIYNQRQLVPAIGNHEDQGKHGPWMYLELFSLPTNGPTTIPKERAYSFIYSNAIFIVLDSNLNPKDQTAWLDQQLANSKATWKFVIYHHPAYSSAANRDNPVLRNAWTPIFDKYHVDMALQGHDHSYMRTYPMHNQKRVKNAKQGTYYIVSVSGVKMYGQGDLPYKELGLTNTSTFQVLDIQISGNRLLYRAYDIDGTLVDKVEINK